MTNSKVKRIGIMTGGGDAPGLNGVIEAASRTLLNHGCEVFGILDGFEGVFNQKSFAINREVVEGLHCQAGTLLGTSSKTKIKGRAQEFQACFQSLRLDGMIAAGGDGTFMGLKELAPDLPILGIPKTIDNDLQGTEITFGFDTACTVVSEAIDSLRATARAHRRVMIVQTMGRSAGWIALGGGLAAYADAILIPERPYDPQRLKDFLESKQKADFRGLVLSVSEAAHALGHEPVFVENKKGGLNPIRYTGVGDQLCEWIEKNTSWEARAVVLGHLQRSRTPTNFDRFLTLEMGTLAAHCVLQGDWNKAIVYRGGKVITAPLNEIQGEPRVVPQNHPWIKFARDVGVWI